MWYRAGAAFVVVVHLLFISFIVGGVFLSWRWPLIIWAHIPAVIYGLLVEFAGLTCPLTLLENGLRQRAGEAGYGGGFISHYLIKVIYPPGLTQGMQIGLGVLLLWWRPSDTGASCAGPSRGERLAEDPSAGPRGRASAAGYAAVASPSRRSVRWPAAVPGVGPTWADRR
jgi:hypothetical protein